MFGIGVGAWEERKGGAEEIIEVISEMGLKILKRGNPRNPHILSVSCAVNFLQRSWEGEDNKPD
jgi:hypothetical protein